MIIIDLETTGVSVTTDRIVQIGAIEINGTEIISEKNMLVNPGMPISAGATEVHGISDEDVKDAPLFGRISKSLFEFLDGRKIGGYNSNSFDIPILIEEFSRVGIDWNPDLSDLVDFFRMEAAIYQRNLSAAYKRYTGKELDDAHDALADVKATFEVMKGQMKKTGLSVDEFPGFYEDPDRKTIDLRGCFYEKEGEIYFAFGKHKDKPASENKDYLNWMIRQDFPKQTKLIIEKILES